MKNIFFLWGSPMNTGNENPDPPNRNKTALLLQT